MIPVFSVIGLFITSLLGIHTDSDKLVNLFAKGDASELSVYFNASMQLAIPGKEGVYSKAQARMILDDFFENNKPVSAKLSSKGNSENGAQYVTIALSTATEKFKVSVFYRGKDSKLKIHELKIEK